MSTRYVYPAPRGFHALQRAVKLRTYSWAVSVLASLLTGRLRAAGQLALAYVTAKTHGLEEEAARVAEAIGEGHLPQVEGGAPLLLPPTPILKEDNWPLLTVTKGFFENLAQQGAHAQSCDALHTYGQALTC